MTKNYLFAGAALCAAALAFGPVSVVAQDTNAAAATQPAPPPARPAPQRNMIYLRGAVLNLDRVIADLQRNENDFNGHRQSAIDACTKAREELAEIAKEAGVPLLRQPGTPGAMRRPPPPQGAPGAPAQPAAPAPPPPAAAPQ